MVLVDHRYGAGTDGRVAMQGGVFGGLGGVPTGYRSACRGLASMAGFGPILSKNYVVTHGS
jgi:hypothetical protein